MSSASPPHLDDETLSGLLDGEPAPAAGHLAGCAACRARQAQLAEARQAVAAPLESLDELTRRRLLSTAVAAGHSPAPIRWYRRPAVIGGIAAAAAAMLLAVPVLNSLDGGGSDDASTAAPALSAETAGEGGAAVFPTDLGDLGEVTASALRARLGSGDTGAGAMAEDSAQLAPPAAPATKEQEQAGRNAAPLEENASDSRAGGVEPCVQAVMADAARGGQLRATATGTLNGTPVTVVVVDRDGATRGYVAARDGCRLVETYTL